MFIKQKIKNDPTFRGVVSMTLFHLKQSFMVEQLRRRIFKNELIALNAEWKLHSARGLMTFKNEF